MSSARAFLLIGVLLFALSALWAGQRALADAPEQCVNCASFEFPDATPTDAYGALMHRLDLVGDPPDPFVADVLQRARGMARPERIASALVLQDPEHTRVPLRPPRAA